MSMQVEIIDFFRPDSSRKNLFISGIQGFQNEDDVLHKLTEVFGHYGLLYGIQVYPYQRQTKKECTLDTKEADASRDYYAFVNFYTVSSATRAKETLNNVLHLQGAECKISYAKRQKEVQDKQTLYVTRCYELANYYLSFNGWSTKIKTLFEDEESRVTTDNTLTIRYVCLVELSVLDLHTDGVGVWQETYAKNDPAGKFQAICKCKKLSYHRAVENAFSKVLLVVLGNGKVSVEVDTTKPDYDTDILPDDRLVKVNELTLQPESEEGVEEREDTVAGDDLDDLNLHILQELEDDM